MIRIILSWFGYKVLYKCEWGTYDHIYSRIDQMAGRPIHKDMRVAPPWAKITITRNSI